MTKVTRRLMVGALMVRGWPWLHGWPKMQAKQPQRAANIVQSGSRSIGALIVQATEHSTTFCGMVETINSSDSFVYVKEDKCGRGVRAKMEIPAEMFPKT